MFYYYVHGLNLQSDIELPNFVGFQNDRQTKKPCDVVIRRKGLPPPMPEYDGETEYYRRISPQEALLYHKSVGTVIVRNGCEIIVYPTADADEWTIKLFLIGTILAITLYQRGMLVLHGSAIRINGAAVAFVGTSGVGKSSIAAALHARGHAVISDDIIPIDLDTDLPLALPGFPMLKMDNLTALSMNIDLDSLQSIPVGKQKYGSLTPAQFQKDPVPLAHVFILMSAKFRKIERLGPQAAFLELIRNAPPTMWNMPGDAGHTFRCAKIVNRVPISSFSREFGREALLDHARMIEDYLENSCGQRIAILEPVNEHSTN